MPRAIPIASERLSDALGTLREVLPPAGRFGPHLDPARRRSYGLIAAGFTKDMTAGRGYIALAALILAKWKPIPVLFACLFFGFTEALTFVIPDIAKQFNIEEIPVHMGVGEHGTWRLAPLSVQLCHARVETPRGGRDVCVGTHHDGIGRPEFKLETREMGC